MHRAKKRTKMDLRVDNRLVIEPAGDEYLILDPKENSVVRVGGGEAIVLASVLSGVRMEQPDLQAVQKLVDLGILVEQTQALSRRKVLGLGAAAGAAGFFAMTLPTAAYASSSCIFTLEGSWAWNGPDRADVCVSISQNTCGFDKLDVRVDGGAVLTVIRGGDSLTITGTDVDGNIGFTLGSEPTVLQARGTFSAGGSASDWTTVTKLG
jgi:hypothetical protein